MPENTGNLTWGGEDWHTLYIPSSTSLYAIKTIVGELQKDDAVRDEALCQRLVDQCFDSDDYVEGRR